MHYLILVALALIAPAAMGQDCQDYRGQTVTPLPVEAVIRRFDGFRPKGEFETTAEYEARVAAAGGSARLIVLAREPDSNAFPYDADTQLLRVTVYAFNNYTAFVPTEIGSGGDAITIRWKDTPAGTFRGTNAFGATVDVVRVKRSTTLLYAGGHWFGPLGIFRPSGQPPLSGESSVLGELKLSPAEAQALKPQLTTAFIVTPRAPYVGRWSRTHRATADSPREVAVDFTMLLADIHCGLLMDGTSRVLEAYSARAGSR